MTALTAETASGVSPKFSADRVGPEVPFSPAFIGEDRHLCVRLASEQTDYVLDALGRRIGKVVDGVLVKGWLYGKDSLRPLAQLDEDGEIEATFVYETGVNVPDYVVLSGGGVLRVVTDHLGSVRLVVDASSGAVVQRIDYSEWGEATLMSGTWHVSPFGFAGGLYDPDTGLVRFGQRDYDAVTGTWTAKDPILFEGGTTNLYEYVENDAINKVDPKGLNPAAAGLCATPIGAPVCAAVADVTVEVLILIGYTIAKCAEAATRDKGPCVFVREVYWSGPTKTCVYNCPGWGTVTFQQYKDKPCPPVGPNGLVDTTGLPGSK